MQPLASHRIAPRQSISRLQTAHNGLATALASKIVGESLDDQVRQSRVVDRFLVDLEGSK